MPTERDPNDRRQEIIKASEIGNVDHETKVILITTRPCVLRSQNIILRIVRLPTAISIRQAFRILISFYLVHWESTYCGSACCQPPQPTLVQVFSRWEYM